MDINIFDDPNQVPKPRDEVKIERLAVTPYPDRFRVFVEVDLTPFQERPNLIIVMRDATDKVVNELNVIETMHAKMEFTLHMRGMADPAGDYSLHAELFYETRQPPQDRKSTRFNIPAEETDE